MYSKLFTRSIKQQRFMQRRNYVVAKNDLRANDSKGLIFAGLAVLGAGSYYYYKKTNEDDNLPSDLKKKVKNTVNDTTTHHKAQDNPMVAEKVSSDKSKPDWESKLEQGSKDTNKDTSRLVGKDTDKVKGVWENKDKDDQVSRTPASVNEQNEGSSFWNNLLSGNNEQTSGAPKTNLEAQDDTTKKGSFSSWVTGSNERRPSTGNPMVDEKLYPGKTKTEKDERMEAYANDVIHDTSNLVEKDTDKIKGVWERRSKPNITDSPNEEKKSFWSSLFGSSKEKEADASWNSAKDKLNDAKEDTASTAYRDAQRLSGAWGDAKHAASAESDRLKQDANATWDRTKDRAYADANSVKNQAESVWDHASAKANNAYDSAQEEGARLKREASDEYNYQKNRLSGSINGLHREVSENADRWKDQAEHKAKSWYEKGTEQVKSSLSTVKDTASQDIQWAERKVQDSLSTAKGEVDRLFGKNETGPTGLQGHFVRGENFAEEEEGVLRPTRDALGRVPARVVVEHARGSDM
ncbi:unnamed protein product [Rhizopus microsporus]